MKKKIPVHEYLFQMARDQAEQRKAEIRLDIRVKALMKEIPFEAIKHQ